MLGSFITHAGSPGAGLDQHAVAARLGEWKRNQAWLLEQFDRDGDGSIDQQEWSAARMRAEQAVAADQEPAPGPPAVDVIGQTGDRRRPFVIAADGENAVVARSRWAAIALLTCGAPLVSLLLWLLIARFSVV